MKKITTFFFGILVVFVIGLILTKNSQASVDYNYRYQILTQGSVYEANQNLEIKLYINVQGEQVSQANVTVNYDTNSLQLLEVKPWEVFEINADTATNGSIQITGSTKHLFSGEAPIAYLSFQTKQPINDLNQVLTINSDPIIQPSNSPTQTAEIAITATPTTIPAQTVYPTSTIEIANCPVIEGNGELTLVIIADKYTDLAEFQNDALLAVESLKRTNLSDSILSKFTFRYSSDISKDYGVYIDEQSADLNMSLARLTQQDCQGDAFLIISKKYPTKESSFGVGGFSMIGNMMAVVFKHSLFVTPHELGHALPGLFDEYDLDISSNTEAQYYNCAGPDKVRCQEWQQQFPNDSNIGCFPVCGYRNWYRSTQFSVMNNNPQYMNYYNPPSIKMWEDFMNLLY